MAFTLVSSGQHDSLIDPTVNKEEVERLRKEFSLLSPEEQEAKRKLLRDELYEAIVLSMR